MDQQAGLPPSDIGALVRYWRETRRSSQMQLAFDAGVSCKHISFIETGRARPSPGMVNQICEALDIPLRERNVLFLAAGHAPRYRERRENSPELAEVQHALQLMLDKHEPYPCLVMDRCFNIVKVNRAADMLLAHVLSGPPPFVLNAMRLVLHPAGLRPAIEGWTPAARRMLKLLHRAAHASPHDAPLRAVLEEVLAYPGLPEARVEDTFEIPPPVLALSIRSESRTWRLFSAITTFGAAQDVSLEGLRIECFFPADEPTRLALNELAMTQSGGR